MLDEDHNWAIDVPGLKDNLREARKHCDPRIMVVINPGNPTGNTSCHNLMIEVYYMYMEYMYMEYMYQ